MVHSNLRRLGNIYNEWTFMLQSHKQGSGRCTDLILLYEEADIR